MSFWGERACRTWWGGGSAGGMRTQVEIDGRDFRINGALTYAGRVHEGRRVEGLLLNSRMVQAIFDDECDATRGTWAYPDTGVWDAERNVREFIAALPVYREHGLLGVTVGLQGGGSVYTSPVYETHVNSAFTPEGELKPAYMERLRRVLAAADGLGMVVIVNYFYWRQERFVSDAAVERATERATSWLLSSGYRNVLVDVKNEITAGEGIAKSGGIHRLLQVVRGTTLGGAAAHGGDVGASAPAFSAGRVVEVCGFSDAARERLAAACVAGGVAADQA